MSDRGAESEGFFPLDLVKSDTEKALDRLRSIRDSDESSNAEIVSAIKEIQRITGGADDGRAGPGSMTRAELQAELERVRAQIGALMGAKA